MSAKKLVLVTGASGFLGAQIVDYLFQAGYAVRGTSRSGKADQLRKNYVNPDFEVAVVDDLVKGDFSAALKGVNSVIHVASPLSQGTNHIEVAVEGTLNLLRQAHTAQVYKITIIGSFVAAFSKSEDLLDASRVITERDWRVVTEEALKPDAPPFEVYAASKTFAEHATWDFVKSHPEMDVIILLPPYIYGPLAPAQVVTVPQTTLSTNRHIYSLIRRPTPAYPPALAPLTVDVRDVARAAVLALEAKLPHAGEQRRILLWGSSFTWKQAVQHLASVRPELKGRLVDGGEPEMEEEQPTARLDNSQAKELLGLNEFIGWKQTVEDTVDTILKREHTWTE